MKKLILLLKCFVMVVVLFNVGIKDERAEERIEYIESLKDKINIEYDEETKEYIIKGINDGGLYIMYTIDMEDFADSEEAKLFVDSVNSSIGKETIDMSTITDEELQQVLDSGLGKCMNIDGRDNRISTSDIRVKENSIVSIDRVDDSAFKTYYYNDGLYKMDLYSITGTYAFILEKKHIEQDTEEDTDKNEDKEPSKDTQKDNGENNKSENDTDAKENNKDNEKNHDNKQDDNENKSENNDNEVIKMDESPKTGDFNTVVYGMVYALLCGCGIMLIVRKLKDYR